MKRAPLGLDFESNRSNWGHTTYSPLTAHENPSGVPVLAY